MNRRSPSVHAAVLALLLTTGLAQTEQPPLRGFKLIHSRSERELESRFMAAIDPNHLRSALRDLTSEPHIAGSDGDRRTAEYVLRQFRTYGLDARIEEVEIRSSEPVQLQFDLLTPKAYSGPTPESLNGDLSLNQHRVPLAFNAFASSNSVTAGVVYANYGLAEDFDFLRSLGLTVEGKIVIARYGRCYRGVKAMLAEKSKAVGLILYSDPEDDGYHAGTVYPRGPWRPPSGVQRGSVLYEFIKPGIPNDESTVPHIPVLPLSYLDARHILQSLGGAAAPKAWQGGLPFTYHLGPGVAKVRLSVKLQSPRRTIWNVIAKIPGRATPEEIVIAGNHRDAWVYGAVDPSSGTATMLDVAKALGLLLRQGWRPQRAIWLCSWDGEELGEFGSSDWTEKHNRELQDEAAAYLNLDGAVSGENFAASSTPSLKQFMREVAADVLDPQGGASVLAMANKRLRDGLRKCLAQGTVTSCANKLEGSSDPISGREFEIEDLGGGSDFISFFNHWGVPSTEFTFSGNYGVYHSAFDDFRWMQDFGDPHFLYHVAAAHLYGLEILRLTEADVLPFDYKDYGRAVAKSIDEIRARLNLSEKTGKLDLAAAAAVADKFSAAGETVNRWSQHALSSETSEPNFHRINRRLVETERELLLPGGLPGRPWYRHAVFAPDLKNGYTASILPGVRESIDADDWSESTRQLEALIEVLNRASARLLSSFDVQ
jgi:N-acetylated-alpha-linked acidic dipeptidase